MTDISIRILYVAGAGALGALSRWGLSRLTHVVLGDHWPYGTLVVNIAGCFIFGLVFETFRDRLVVDHHLRLLLLTGFAGAFTTYSTFAFDTYQLAVDRHMIWASLNVTLHVALGMMGLVLGIAAGRFVA